MSSSIRYKTDTSPLANIVKAKTKKYLYKILKQAILDGVNLSQTHIKKLWLTHNLAYAEYTVDKVYNSSDAVHGNCIAHSKVSTKERPEHPLIEYGFAPLKVMGRKFKHVNVDNRKNLNCGTSHPRLGDSEAKILEYLADIFDRDTKGKVYLYTGLEPCLSCDYEIIQFLEFFPGIELIIFYDLDYN